MGPMADPWTHSRVLLLFLTVHFLLSHALDASVGLSTYQTGASNVTLYANVSLQLSVPPVGMIVISVPGTTNVDPASGLALSPTMWCPDATAALCRTFNLIAPKGGPFYIVAPEGIPAGSAISLAIGNAFNQPEAGPSAPIEVRTTTLANVIIEESQKSIRFVYTNFYGALKLDSYQSGTVPVSLTVFFVPGQDIVQEDKVQLWLHVAGVSGLGTLDCDTLWSLTASPLPSCSNELLAQNGNPYALILPSLLSDVQYSFTLTGLELAAEPGLTDGHTMMLKFNDALQSTHRLHPFHLFDIQELEDREATEAPETDMQSAYKVTETGRIILGHQHTNAYWMGHVDPARPFDFGLDLFKTQMAILFSTGIPGRILILGLGLGAIPTMAHALRPDLYIDIVDIDKEIIRRTSSMPHFPRTSRLKLIEDDASRFVQRRDLRGQYDFIFFDAYDSRGIPKVFQTLTFYENALRCLRPSGVLSLNLIPTLPEASRIRQHLRRLLVSAFVIPSQGNDNVFGWASAGAALSPPVMSTQAAAMDAEGTLPFSLEAELRRILHF